MLLYRNITCVLVYMLNVLLKITFKIFFRSLYIDTHLKKKKNRFSFKTTNLVYNSPIYEFNIDIFEFICTTLWHRSIKINKAAITIKEYSSIPKTQYWNTSYMNQLRDIEYIDQQIKNLLPTSATIKHLDITMDTFKIYCYRICTKKNKTKREVAVGKMKIYFKGAHLATISKVNMSFYADCRAPTIHIKDINILLSLKHIDNNILQSLNELLYPDPDTPPIYPKLFIGHIRANIYIHNYTQLNITAIVLEHSILTCKLLDIIVWKKKVIWVNNFQLNISDRILEPTISNMRIRLLHSTSDKLYKTLIILRKRFFKLPSLPKKKIIIKEPSTPINLLFMKRLHHPIQATTVPVVRVHDRTVIDNFFNVPGHIKFRMNISHTRINTGSDNQFILKHLTFVKTNDSAEYIINNFSFKNRHGEEYITKADLPDKTFRIVFGDKSIELYPYKCRLLLDTQAFADSLGIIHHNMERLTQLFYSKFYTYKSGYIFERFYIHSFYILFNYNKTHINFKKLLFGNKRQLLNLMNIDDLSILLEEVNIRYPYDWKNIMTKIRSTYEQSMHIYNREAIIKTVYGETVNTIINIKPNIECIARKIKSIIHNPPNYESDNR